MSYLIWRTSWLGRDTIESDGHSVVGPPITEIRLHTTEGGREGDIGMLSEAPSDLGANYQQHVVRLGE